MVDSHALRLAFALADVRSALTAYLSRTLRARGHTLASPSVLSFLSELECGVNQASEVARRLGVSRQMVSKTVGELVAAGLLDVRDDPNRRNQKVIIFTRRGEQLMADARQALAELDRSLDDAMGEGALDALVDNLDQLKRRLETECP